VVKGVSELVEFTNMLKPDATQWESYRGHKISRFMQFCINSKNKQMIHSIQNMLTARFEEQGLIYNPLLGWVMPNEIEFEISGIKQLTRGYWVISDTDRFEIYGRIKAREREEAHVEKQKKVYKEEFMEENNQYLEQVIEDDKLPF